MQSVPQNITDEARQAEIREHFRQIIEGRHLPALPVVVTKVLGMLAKPDLNMRVLCPVLSDDPALAARIIAISRSAYYGQRTLPRTLQAAVQVMGLRDLRNVIISVVTYGLFKSSGPVAEALWAHSLGVALASRILVVLLGTPRSRASISRRLIARCRADGSPSRRPGGLFTNRRGCGPEWNSDR